MAVSAQVEEDHALLARLFGLQRLVDGRADRVRTFRRGDDALGARKLHRRVENAHLGIGFGFHDALFVQQRHDRGHAVIAQTARVNSGGHEVVPQRVHLDNGRHAHRVTVIVGVDAFGHAGASGRLGGQETNLLPFLQAFAHEGQDQTGHVAPATGATDHHIGVIVGFGKLQERLFADDGLVQQHVVEHAAERVFGIVVRGGHFHRLTDGDAQAAHVVRIAFQDGAARVGEVGGAGVHRCAERFHHVAAVGLLFVADLDHEDFDLDAEERPGHCQRRTPLPRAGLGGDLADAFFAVVEKLCHGGIGLVAAYRTDALVFVVNARGGVERFFQTAGAEKWAWPPLRVDPTHRFGNFDVALLAHFLQDQRHREKGRQVVRPDRFFGGGVQHRRKWTRQVRNDIVPSLGHFVFVENVLDMGFVRHDRPSLRL